MTDARAHALSLADFVRNSPSSFHAADTAVRMLTEAGFTELDEATPWDLGSGAYVVRRDGAFIAWRQADTVEGFDILGAHTDSPGFKLKPQPTTGAFNLLQAGVEVYGGPLLNSWLDRELRLAGRLVLRDGTERLVATGPVFRIPQLAIHLDRTVNASGLTLDRQDHTQPVWGLGPAEDADLLGYLAEIAGVEAPEVGGYDLLLADSTAPALFGAREEFLASGRLDNLTSVHAGLVALLSGDEPADGRVRMLAAFDHEEIGSGSRSGAGGPFLEDVLVRVVGERGAEWSRTLASSFLLSADAGHAVHPNYPGQHDPHVRPLMGKGVLLKINADQRYATDAYGAARIAALAEEKGFAYQEFVSRNSVPCGSTIGPITATRLGLRTVDVGVPLLSMHSAREMVAVEDLWSLAKLAQGFLA